MKACTKCNNELSNNSFDGNNNQCNECIKNRHREYNKKNSASIKEYRAKYNNENKSKISKKQKEWYENNKSAIRKCQKEYQKNRKKIDIKFKFRSNISSLVSKALKQKCSSKNNQSCFSYFPYSFQELVSHIESRFEPWMNWNNYGKYNSKTWNDLDESTWTWNLDHIIPQSVLQYSSMKDESFNKCWSLNNLRPYSSKQNHLDGVNRDRHIKSA